jgi:hypothetical protein
MRNLLALIGLVVVGFGGIGWYMGWYHLSVAKSPEGNVEIKVDVDSKKVTDDAGKGIAVVGDQVGKVAQDGKAAPSQPAPTSGSLTPQAPAATTDGGWFADLFQTKSAAPQK